MKDKVQARNYYQINVLARGEKCYTINVLCYYSQKGVRGPSGSADDIANAVRDGIRAEMLRVAASGDSTALFSWIAKGAFSAHSFISRVNRHVAGNFLSIDGIVVVEFMEFAG